MTNSKFYRALLIVACLMQVSCAPFIVRNEPHYTLRGQVKTLHIYTYYPDGYIDKETKHFDRTGKLLTREFPWRQTDSILPTIRYTYDRRGYLIAELNQLGTGWEKRTEYINDRRGREIEKRIYTSTEDHPDVSTSRYFPGRRIRITTKYDSDGEPYLYRTEQHNRLGKVIHSRTDMLSDSTWSTSEVSTRYDKGGRMISYGPLWSEMSADTVTYFKSYDAYGNLSLLTTKYANGKTEMSSIAYIYDERGNWLTSMEKTSTDIEYCSERTIIYFRPK